MQPDFLPFWLWGYLSGSLPFALWITRLVKGVDVRASGSGHATTTNTIRQAGWGPGLLVLLLDMVKGFLPVFFAMRADLPAWAIGITAALAVAGHCWPLFAGFRGGMGLAVTGGALLAASLPGFLLALAVLLALVLLLRHAARGSLLAGLLTPALMWWLGLRDAALWIGFFAGLVLAIRFASDWKRQYRELWLDRETA